MSSHKVTVFGGSGFLGRHLVQRLAADGHAVRVAVRNIEAARFLKPLGDPGQIVITAADINNEPSVAAAVAGAQAVVNLVGILWQRGGKTFNRVHVEGAAAVARAAHAAGAQRLVHVSAIGADEESASEYARTKATGEKAVIEAFPGASIVRPSVVFGHEDNFFNLFAGMAMISPVLPVFGNAKFQPVYVGDVAEAITKILADPATGGKTYELGGPTVYTYREIMELLLKQIARRRLLVPAPLALAMVNAWFLEKMPTPLLTRDQVRLLAKDNVVGKKALSFKALGMTPTSAEAILPLYLHHYRPQAEQCLRTA
ncbi:MAG: 3-beta hydroxysteroid dehydrogenase [Rhodospirillales bacterium RIFCSPLOWO2_12_FULL_58_28]|nr:MAG: 3-beta hydroxysteroid dehydrogenase [Rhodospirillales bacterium RIFCSPLOWO2_02_FULL_58_16]OHC77248.1 MAG: 3-beta hydroxysteroid dehydrogenase [Rhodospirillales bacterium RIFCSPLOWO2_12_FULL_58_28]